MDRLIFKKENLLQMEYLIHLFSKKTENKYMYILTKRGHSKHTIKNLDLGNKKYIICNAIKSDVFIIQNTFLTRLRNRD